MDVSGTEDAPSPAEARAVRRAISPNFIVLVAICAGLGAALVFEPGLLGPLTFAFVAAGWVLSVVLHEFGHAVVAYRAGDHSVVRKGYLSLDPLKYTDLQTTILFPLIALALGGIGFPGAAVYLRPDLMRSRIGRSLASLAGPAMTALVLVGLGIGIAALHDPGPLANALAFLAFLQATALVLNLLPVPGLDGYGVLRPFLPVSLARSLRPVERIALLILLGALLLVPGVSDQLFDTALQITDLLGIPRPGIGAGLHSFRFWEGFKV